LKMAEEEKAITAISVKGFKSFAEEQRIEIRPLTILAGANSSGKSSALQPLLLLKQTLEASYDPGPLLLDGPHVHFTSAEQLLTRLGGHASAEFEIMFEVDHVPLRNVFRGRADGTLDIIRTVHPIRGTLEPDMTNEEVEDRVLPIEKAVNRTESGWRVERYRCFLILRRPGGYGLHVIDHQEGALRSFHVPGLRGNPARTYATAAVGDYFPGTFEHYVASLILAWQQTRDERLSALDHALEALGLTWKVHAKRVDATQVEILVGRLPSKKRVGAGDLVNIADVGFGVSQTLPVLVALLAAQPGQLVYLEQPELHLHPRAQQALAPILAEAAMRGVRVVAETHSSLLLLAIQALVAEGKLPPEQVILHWFQRDSRGATQVMTGDLDRMGAYGDWPEDFYSVSAAVENRYLDAVESTALATAQHGKKKTNRR
jgi:predicted ATPase